MRRAEVHDRELGAGLAERGGGRRRQMRIAGLVPTPTVAVTLSVRPPNTDSVLLNWFVT